MIGTEWVTVTRRVGHYLRGVWVPLGQSQKIPVLATVTPLDPRTAVLISEGMRTTARYEMYAADGEPELRCGSVVGEQAADRVTYRAHDYVVQSVEDMTTTAGVPHRHYVLTEIGDDVAEVARV